MRAADDGIAPVTLFDRNNGFVAEPAWSPDGTRIAFVSDWELFDAWFDVWVVAPDGSQALSPDGRRIAHVECPWSWGGCGSSAITVMNADGSALVRVAVASGFADPTWSPDGQTIAFASANSLEWVSADGLQRGRIIANGTSPAWRPLVTD